MSKGRRISALYRMSDVPEELLLTRRVGRMGYRGMQESGTGDLREERQEDTGAG